MSLEIRCKNTFGKKILKPLIVGILVLEYQLNLKADAYLLVFYQIKDLLIFYLTALRRIFVFLRPFQKINPNA